MSHSDFTGEAAQTAITQYVKRNVGKPKLEIEPMVTPIHTTTEVKA